MMIVEILNPAPNTYRWSLCIEGVCPDCKIPFAVHHRRFGYHQDMLADWCERCEKAFLQEMKK